MPPLQPAGRRRYSSFLPAGRRRYLSRPQRKSPLGGRAGYNCFDRLLLVAIEAVAFFVAAVAGGLQAAGAAGAVILLLLPLGFRRELDRRQLLSCQCFVHRAELFAGGVVELLDDI